MDFLSVSGASKMTKKKTSEVIEQERIESEIDNRYSVYVSALDRNKKTILDKIMKNYTVVN